ncbi:MAG: hypothetical protein ACI83O_000712 [Patescibacteria group bacterium]|jgi:hypothetical protein
MEYKDYASPILYREGPIIYEGEFSTDVAENILKRQFGFLEEARPKDLRKIEEVLLLRPNRTRYKAMKSSIVPYQKNQTLNLFVAKSYKQHNENPHADITVTCSCPEDMIDDFKDEPRRESYYVPEIVQDVFGIEARINEVKMSELTFIFSLKANLYYPSHMYEITSTITTT